MRSEHHVAGLTVAELYALALQPPPTLPQKIAYFEARGEVAAREWLGELAERRAAAERELERRAVDEIDEPRTADVIAA